jgi:hypothetical protein
MLLPMRDQILIFPFLSIYLQQLNKQYNNSFDWLRRPLLYVPNIDSQEHKHYVLMYWLEYYGNRKRKTSKIII